MKNIVSTSWLLVMIALGWSACGHDSAKSSIASDNAPDSATQYICPMNCEKGKTYDQPGTCPICHMDLKPITVAQKANTAEYFSRFSAEPTPLEAGKPAKLMFTPSIRGNESALVPLDLIHEKKMHLIVVSDDLSWFDHIHPAYTTSGAYEIKVIGQGEPFANGRGHDETRFDYGGKYWAFADYKPTGGLNQVNQIELNVQGLASTQTTYSSAKTVAKVDGYTVAIELPKEQKDLKTGISLDFPVSIQKNDKAVDPASFDLFLGEKAHVVMIETSSKAYVHTHPEAKDGRLHILTSFSTPGIYRAWLQFQTEGVVHTADFVLKVVGEKTNLEGHSH